MKARLLSQRQAALAIAGRNDHVAVTGITEGGNDGFPLPPLSGTTRGRRVRADGRRSGW
ncbi:hypothetical protein Q2406_03250 [Klebsiella pneumoniae]|nr:hypothetical protein [Klebsiella pneumoniae]